MQDEGDDQRGCADERGEHGEFLLADLRAELCGKGRHTQRHNGLDQGAGGLGAAVIEVVGIDVGGHAGEGELCQQEQQRAHHDADQGLVGDEALEELAKLELLVLRLNDHALGAEEVAEQVANDRADGADQGDNDHLAAVQGGVAVGVAVVDDLRNDNADERAGQCRADGAPGAQRAALGGLIRDGGGHGAVGDVDARVAD